MKKVYILILSVWLSIIMASPGFSENLSPTNTPPTTAGQSSTNSNPPQSQSDSVKQQTHSENTQDKAAENQTNGAKPGGIQPVSPTVFFGKINNMVDKIYNSIKPLVLNISKGMILIVALILVFAIFLGPKVMQKAFGALLCIFLGLMLFYNADNVLGVTQWFSNYLNTGGN